MHIPLCVCAPVCWDLPACISAPIDSLSAIQVFLVCRIEWGKNRVLGFPGLCGSRPVLFSPICYRGRTKQTITWYGILAHTHAHTHAHAIHKYTHTGFHIRRSAEPRKGRQLQRPGHCDPSPDQSDRFKLKPLNVGLIEFSFQQFVDSYTVLHTCNLIRLAHPHVRAGPLRTWLVFLSAKICTCRLSGIAESRKRNSRVV